MKRVHERTSERTSDGMRGKLDQINVRMSEGVRGERMRVEGKDDG